MTTQVFILWPIALVFFVVGVVLGRIVSRIPKRRALEWFVVPAIATLAVMVTMPQSFLAVLLLWVPILLGLIVAFALAAASGRGIFENYQPWTPPQE